MRIDTFKLKLAQDSEALDTPVVELDGKRYLLAEVELSARVLRRDWEDAEYRRHHPGPDPTQEAS